MKKKLLVLFIITSLVSCQSNNVKTETEVQSQRNENIPTLDLGHGFTIEGSDIETYRKYGVFTKLEILRDGIVIYDYDNVDEFNIEKLEVYLIPLKEENEFEILFEEHQPPSKSRLIKLYIKNNNVMSREQVPSFEREATNLDDDKNLEFAGYWNWTEPLDDKNEFTYYNPILFYEITDLGLRLDTILTQNVNVYIYGNFNGFAEGSGGKQQIEKLHIRNKVIDLIKAGDISSINSTLNYQGANPVITFIGEEVYNDTLVFKRRFLVQIEVEGVPETLLRISITNGTIRRANLPGQYEICPKILGEMMFSIAYFDERSPEAFEFVAEGMFVLVSK
ncbi:MAG: hypothetical protein HOF35_07805 [Bacteroidetes bacterium]|nr:hypothetical protein [Bacteroidota bacterium]